MAKQENSCKLILPNTKVRRNWTILNFCLQQGTSSAGLPSLYSDHFSNYDRGNIWNQNHATFYQNLVSAWAQHSDETPNQSQCLECITPYPFGIIRSNFIFARMDAQISTRASVLIIHWTIFSFGSNLQRLPFFCKIFLLINKIITQNLEEQILHILI